MTTDEKLCLTSVVISVIAVLMNLANYYFYLRP